MTMPDAMIVVLATVPVLGVVAVVAMYLYSVSKDRAAVVETNAMLAYHCRKVTDAAVCGEHSQIDRIQSENELAAATGRKPREQFNQQSAKIGYGPPSDADLADLMGERTTPGGGV